MIKKKKEYKAVFTPPTKKKYHSSLLHNIPNSPTTATHLFSLTQYYASSLMEDIHIFTHKLSKRE